MDNLSKNKNLFGLIAIVCIIGFTSSSFAASINAPQLIPNGKVYVFNGSQKIAELTAESPLPQGKQLKIEGTCGIKMDSLYLVATDKSNLMVNIEKLKQKLLVNDGRVFFGITAISNPISFMTPIGGVVAQQVMLKAASQPSILEGYVDVSEKGAEIGVISGGAMVISTADGEVTINEGERFLLAQSDVSGGTTKTKEPSNEITGGQIGTIVGTIVGTTGGALILQNENEPVSKK